MTGNRVVTVVVVGAGPRGLSVVERLSANAAVLGRPVVVHLVDPYILRGGRVWQTTQSPDLLMNTVASQVTMFTDASVRCEGPILPGPSLHEWALMVAAGGPDTPALPQRARDEAARLGPDSYPSRSFYGHYLTWVLDRLIRTAPAEVSIIMQRHRAVALDEDEHGAQVVTLGDGTALVADCVVLAQGHIEMPPDPAGRRLREHAAERGLPYLPPGSPAEADLGGIAPGSRVVLRGLGLNFFDFLALLTAGRGGRFVRDAQGALSYLPSGREPVMFAGSRRGVPYHARGENQKGAYGRYLPRLLTPEVISALRKRRADGARIEFRRHLWPLIDREVTCVYYHALITDRGSARQADAFRAEADRTPVDVPLDERLLALHGIAPEDRWDWDRIGRPQGKRVFAGPAEHRDWLLAYLREDLAEARRGNVEGPLKAALDVMRDLRNEIRLVVDHAGITGESYRDELQSWYTPLNAFLSIGPPPSRIEELIAVIEAGLLTVVGPGMRIEPSPGGFTAHSAAVPGSLVEADALIEARLPEVDIRATTDPLIQGLLRRGACRAYVIPTGTDGHAETGGLMVTARPYRLVDAAGQAHPSRFAFGVPTESVHWATAAGIRPGVDSVILGDADAVARACLATTAWPRLPAVHRAVTAPRPPAHAPAPRSAPTPG